MALTQISRSQRALTRGRLLSVAADLFRRHGYAGTTTRQLAGVLGIQSASLYHHMGKKEDLLFEMSVEALETVTTQVQAAVAANSTIASSLHELVRAHVVACLTHQDEHAVMLMELRSLSEEPRRSVLRLRDRYESYVESVIADCQGSGVVRRDIPSRHLTLALLNLVNWTIFWYRRDGELSPDALADLLSTVFVEGSGPAISSPADMTSLDTDLG